MYLPRIPKLVQHKLSSAVWSISNSRSVFLTFDDGPSSQTNRVLETLSQTETKASFFLLGKQIEKHPTLLEKIKSDGHVVGNHGYEHLSGWSTSAEEYQHNLVKGKELSSSNLYRPPYGRMTPKQWKSAAQENRVVMWDVMPGDFDEFISDEEVTRRAIQLSEPGSIIVLHDNETCAPRLVKILPEIIIGIQKKGFQLEALPFQS